MSKLPVIYIVFICILLFEKTNSFGQQFLDTASFSSVVKPGDNFFLYADGKWFDTVRIPSTETSTGSFSDLAKKSRAKLKYILDSVADGKQTPGSIEQKTGDFYASGIDTATIEKRGYDPVKPYFKQIDLIENTAGIMQFVTAMQKQGDPVLFNFYIGSDEKNSAVNIAAFSQGGIGLPDRDYYFKNDPSTQAVVNAYKNYIQTLFTLTGDDSVSAAQKTSLVYELEKDIAASHRTNIELRDPQSNYHKLLVADINKQMSAFDWDATLNELGLHVDSINLQQPNFYSKIDTLLKTVPLSTWKAYLRFHVLSSYAFLLSSDFINAQFAYAKILTGQSKIKPRWERMVITTDNYLGEALGQLYVKKIFP
ncbi:MAG: M13 family metallopeptidase N-terminal domain-containing protein [Ferruginibacter sp.]